MQLPTDTHFPHMKTVEQSLAGGRIEDVEADIRAKLRGYGLAARIPEGGRVGIAVGSRGAGGLVELLRGVVGEIRDAGGDPFIIPAMGSHGGATPAGQVQTLACCGITEQAVGAPIDPRMETVVLGEARHGYKAHYAVSAQEADAVIVLGRPQLHSGLKAGEHSDGVSSGLLKMTVIGLGKQAGAESAHHHGLVESILAAQDLQVTHSNIVAGIAIVENGYRQLHTIEVARPEDFKSTDQRLLRIAQSVFPTLPFDDLDVLIIDWMGKDINGSGIDPNVTGFWRLEGGPRVPDYRRIVALNLTRASLGNAIGIGQMDFVSERLIGEMDTYSTWINMLTAASKEDNLQEARTPIAGKTDREAIGMAFGSIMPVENPKVCHIHDTSRLWRMDISEALSAAAEKQPNMRVVSDLHPLEFDDAGTLRAIEL